MLRSLLIGVAICIAAPAWAQSTQATFDGLPSNHPIVYVIDDSGVETTGRLLRFDSSSLTVAIRNAEVPFAIDHVRTVDRRDSLFKGGTLIGAVVGGIIGGIGAAMMGSGSCNRYPDPVRPCGTGERVGVFALYTGLGTGLGLLLDKVHHGRSRLYEAAGARQP